VLKVSSASYCCWVIARSSAGLFGDGSRWGIKIAYSVTPVQDETAGESNAPSICSMNVLFCLLRQLLAHADG
jgi:hypothetical protein